MNRSVFFLLAFLLSFSSSFCRQPTDKKNKHSVNILFVGNSLTYTNDLPELVKKAAKAKGVKVTSKLLAFPNYALVDHWKDGQVQELIAGNKFDFVIVQQGPSSQSDGRQMLMESGKEYGRLCESKGAKLCYFMVWPALSNYQMFEGVIKNHKDAAALNKAILLPVGEVWKKHIDSTKSNEYYGPDGFHPSLKGSQIAAEVIVEYLFR